MHACIHASFMIDISCYTSIIADYHLTLITASINCIQQQPPLTIHRRFIMSDDGKDSDSNGDGDRREEGEDNMDKIAEEEDGKEEEEDNNGQKQDEQEDEEEEDEEPRVPLKCPMGVAATFRPVNPCSAATSIHPFQRLQYRASVLSGVPIEKAFEVDEVNISKVLNEYYVGELAERFYKRVLADRDEWFSDIWKGSNMEDLIQNFSEYLLQRFGGEAYYSSRRGNPNLVVRHAKFEMSTRTAEKWLNHMYDVLEEMEVVDELPVVSDVCRDVLMNFFRHTAFTMVAAQEDQWNNFQKKDSDDVPINPEEL